MALTGLAAPTACQAFGQGPGSGDTPAGGHAARPHGGPDAQGAARWDFSTNANAAGPCPNAWQAVRAADPTRYPDPGHHALRERLAAHHGVAVERILIAASASEFIQRVTAVGARLAPGAVAVPRHAYGDYAAAARAHGRALVVDHGPSGADATGAGRGPLAEAAATLRWIADPGSPLGQDGAPPADPGHTPTVLDAVYAPLRLEGASPWTPAARDAVFVLVSPNKALGLTGVRGAYAIAPAAAAWPVARWCDALRAAEPSWPLGAHGEAMLQAWTEPASQAWLQASLARLADWKRVLLGRLAAHGAAVQPSVTPFVCARLPVLTPATALRRHGVAVRDAASFGLPGWVRLSAQSPQALQALDAALHGVRSRAHQAQLEPAR